MKQNVASAIVLKRTNFGEADRIIRVLTPERGKITLMAKGVRKVNSKIAGSIELFSVIDITYLLGKGSIERLISARLKKHFGNIVKDINRTNAGYDFIKVIDKITEDELDNVWFDLLAQSFEFLNNESIDSNIIKIWFYLYVLNITGHLPNLVTDTQGNNFTEHTSYNFSLDMMSFEPFDKGEYSSDQIKILKLASQYGPDKLMNIKGINSLSEAIYPLVLKISRISLEL